MADRHAPAAVGSGSLADSFGVVRPYLPECLVPAANADRIDAIARVLPGALATGFGFECHLGEQPPHADFFVRVRASEVGRGVLAGTSTLDALPTSLTDEPTWAHVREFARNWADPAVVATENTDNVWLEFDVDPADEGMPLPSVFFSAYHGILSRLEDAGEAPPSAPDAYGWVTREALPLVLGRPLASATEEMVFRTLDALPRGANVFQVGVMLARASDAVRLCIVDLPAERVVEYLTGLGWAGDTEELQALVDGLATFVDRIVLDIDVADRLSGKLGFECYFTDFRQPGEEARWRTLFDHLVDEDLCRPEQREALLAYPGFVDQAQSAGVWPSHLAAAASLLGPRASSGMARVLHHVKIAYRPGEPLEAKAYLGGTHHWLVDGRVRA